MLGNIQSMILFLSSVIHTTIFTVNENGLIFCRSHFTVVVPPSTLEKCFHCIFQLYHDINFYYQSL